MRTLLAFPSTASFAQQAALAFHERNALAAFMTAFVHRDDGLFSRMVSTAPDKLRSKIEPQLRRRRITAVPPERVEDRPFWEVVRTAADKVGASPPTVDRIWDHMSKSFTRAAGRRLKRDGVKAVYAYEYTALEAFEAARNANVARILDFPSLNSRQFEMIQRREKELFPELKTPHEAYFDALFERRQARRDAEMNAADVIITNSSVTRQSHIDGGADPKKTFAVPYGAPPAVASITERRTDGPLNVIWAGTFSIRKGAHYFVDAWRMLGAVTDAKADIFGAVTLPERLWRPTPPGMSFHGSVPRSALFSAFDQADVLVFPTLSDGFGMVVTEAFARGIPVITTNQAGASDLVSPQRNGLLIPPGDSSVIVDALRWCLDNREALAAMRLPALETARNWQWSDYRAALVAAVTTGLTRSGYTPGFDAPLS
jgi:glycosyltransferase involved in cell wall biosynthesis